MRLNESNDAGIPTGNRLLRGLSNGHVDTLWAKLDPVRFSTGDSVHLAESPAVALYFIESGLVSLTKRMLDGRNVEVCMLGAEGVISPYAILGADTSILGSIVHVPVTAWRLERRYLMLMSRADEIAAIMRQYALGAVGQMIQLTACNALHTVEQRYCRWLLSAHDRVPGDELLVTHETIAEMVGAGRTTVSFVASALADERALRYGRGRIRILDRTRIESHACECYVEMRAQPASSSRYRPGITSDA